MVKIDTFPAIVTWSPGWKSILERLPSTTHAGPPAETYRNYLDAGVHAEYDAWLAQIEAQRRQRQSLFQKEEITLPEDTQGG